jgi:hypothetical protein
LTKTDVIAQKAKMKEKGIQSFANPNETKTYTPVFISVTFIISTSVLLQKVSKPL